MLISNISNFEASTASSGYHYHNAHARACVDTAYVDEHPEAQRKTAYSKQRNDSKLFSRITSRVTGTLQEANYS